ncbi:HAMP domain-containing sensor histidine kinase [Anaeromicrobium sediminis]|uniref:histidine kinase n=1 Tax=Anaeromicrobium sediminis TaxID=1478221 RepID=A0A267MC65_9FIRM|nr:HAMP domain-containing sensor histidine kinase [Anaeromicrobium sediminis]PAB57136.1 hypothetical protein CCE28_19595 [Anaeromicrobium sediminis]
MKTTLKFKFLLGFFVIFLAAFFALNYSLRIMIENNTIGIITNELKYIKKNCNAYVRKSLIINHMNNDETSFRRIVDDTIDEVKNINEAESAAYDLKGNLIYSSNDEIFKNLKHDDLRNALEGLTSYVINKEKNSTVVYFSYPVVIEGEKIGIIRLIMDYSHVYAHIAYIERTVVYITSIIFLLAYIFSCILSKNVIGPIVKLTRASKDIEQGNLMVQIDVKSKDEIGELSMNFNKMVRQINKQIDTIKKDRDNLSALNNHRKFFFDNATHELKTPLTSIMGYAEIIKNNGFHDPEFFNKGMKNIIDESKRLHNLVINLLEVSKETSKIEEEFTRIDICELLIDTCQNMRFKAERYKNRIECSVEDTFYIYGSGNKVKQVFINIIDNAIKYGFVNSVIQVEAYGHDEYIEIKVRNEGQGIKEEDIDKVFTSFYRVDKKKSRELGSCGLGLSIAKSIVENHNGEIKINSIINKETSVLIRLPLCRE